jgi:inhibitor of KinA sporulation pathway (predicted exonuclease)
MSSGKFSLLSGDSSGDEESPVTAAALSGLAKSATDNAAMLRHVSRAFLRGKVQTPMTWVEKRVVRQAATELDKRPEFALAGVSTTLLAESFSSRIPQAVPSRTALGSVCHDIVLVDFECTCDSQRREGFNHEIIEFPAILIDADTFVVKDVFHSYIRPTEEPILTEYCTQLTGISQTTVDAAPPFADVMHSFAAWLDKWSLGFPAFPASLVPPAAAARVQSAVLGDGDGKGRFTSAGSAAPFKSVAHALADSPLAPFYTPLLSQQATLLCEPAPALSPSFAQPPAAAAEPTAASATEAAGAAAPVELPPAARRRALFACHGPADMSSFLAREAGRKGVDLRWLLRTGLPGRPLPPRSSPAPATTADAESPASPASVSEDGARRRSRVSFSRPPPAPAAVAADSEPAATVAAASGSNGSGFIASLDAKTAAAQEREQLQASAQLLHSVSARRMQPVAAPVTLPSSDRLQNKKTGKHASGYHNGGKQQHRPWSHQLHQQQSKGGGFGAPSQLGNVAKVASQVSLQAAGYPPATVLMPFIDIRYSFALTARVLRAQHSMKGTSPPYTVANMLSALGFKFAGRQHKYVLDYGMRMFVC